MTTYEFDFFLSRAGADAAIATSIAEILRAEDFTVVIQDDFGSAHILVRMEEAARRSKRTISLLSAAYLQSEYCRIEWMDRVYGDLSNTGDRLIIFRVQPCSVEGFLRFYARTDLTGILQDRALLKQVVLARILGRGSQSARSVLAQSTESGEPLIHAEIHHHPNFTARDEELRAIADAFARDVPDPRPVVLDGMPGVGKSAIAHEYALRNKDRYSAVWAINGETAEIADLGLAQLGFKISPPLQKVGDRREVADVTLSHLLSQLPKRTLLILDLPFNADRVRVKRLRGRENVDVLVTSSAHNWGDEMTRVEVAPLAADEALRLFRSVHARNDIAPADARTIAVELFEGLPAAIVQAGEYLRDNQAVSAGTYVENIGTFLKSTRAGEPSGTPVFAAFTMALQNAERGASGAKAFVRIAACYHRSEIPDSLFRQRRALYPAALRSRLGHTVRRQELLSALERLRLLRLGHAQTAATFSLPSIVRLVAAELPGGQDRYARVALRAAEAAFPEEPEQDVAGALALVPHYLSALKLAARRGIRPSLIAAAAAVAPFLVDRALYADAMTVGEICVRRRGASSAKMRGAMAGLYYVRGRALMEQGKLQESRREYGRGLRLAIGSGPRARLRRAEALRGLGYLDLRAENYEAALRKVRRSLELLKRPTTMDARRQRCATLTTLCIVLYRSGRLQEAHHVLEDAKESARRLAGRFPQMYARVLTNFGGYYKLVGDWEAARRVLEEALSVTRSALGVFHPHVARESHNLAETYGVLGEFERGIPLAEDAAKIFETFYGKEHPHARVARDNAARLNEAERECRESGTRADVRDKWIAHFMEESRRPA